MGKIFFAKVLLAAFVIAFASWLSGKKTELSKLIKMSSYIDPNDKFVFFCHYVLKIKISQHDKAVAKGNVHYFVRALKPKIVDDATVDICREFQVLKRRLKIEW